MIITYVYTHTHTHVHVCVWTRTHVHARTQSTHTHVRTRVCAYLKRFPISFLLLKRFIIIFIIAILNFDFFARKQLESDVSQRLPAFHYEQNHVVLAGGIEKRDWCVFVLI